MDDDMIGLLTDRLRENAAERARLVREATLVREAGHTVANGRDAGVGDGSAARGRDRARRLAGDPMTQFRVTPPESAQRLKGKA